MNRKLILSALVVGGLIGTAVSCTVTQPPEGCAVESGGSYWARYTITASSGNCAFLQTYDPSGNVIKDSSGNLLAAEEIDIQAYGPATGTTTIQETPGFFDVNSGSNAIGTQGPFNANYCTESGITAAVGTVADPNFAPVIPSPPTPADGGSVDGGLPVDGGAPVDAGPPPTGPQDTCQVCAQNSDCMSGNCNLTAELLPGSVDGGLLGLCDVAVGASCANASDCGANGGTCDPTDTTCGCAPPTVQVTYAFSNLQFEQAYSILGKQFHGSLQYDMVPAPAGFGASECHATITVDAVQYNDFAAGSPGHLEGNHCEMDPVFSKGDATDCTAHAGVYGFPADTGWICMPLVSVDQTLYQVAYPDGGTGGESYADGGLSLPYPDGGFSPIIPGQRCVPGGAVPIGAAND